MSIIIYHNPDCGTSRNVLAMLREAGEDLCVIEYLKTPPDRATLERIITDTGLAVRDILRIKGTPYAELGLDDAALTDAQLIDAMLVHPMLINRPIVVTPRGTRLCRPSDAVVDVLAHAPEREMLKEDGVPFIVARAIPGDDATFVQTMRDAQLPVDDLSEPGRAFFKFSTLAGVHIGYGGFERYGSDALVRSIVVASGHRGMGIGRNLLFVLLHEAFDAGARTAWLLTTDTSAFFEKTGFRAVMREAAPPTILMTQQACTLCPASAVLMSRAITL
ncbi:MULTISPECIES: arsenic resistance N-acetyltransferase ArsN2 [Caballeronia]|uniref:arsenic resistance N-acetyltransferase ArsN2 n=1 Tax=Caballeronia TaxID=1827195 RepID=UPI00094E8445|nr:MULTISPECIES: arsenic resistance N-acetyltransferase ArsN2 [Caballeronia]MCE4547940.1 arsenic resistance N-acetyltransferase ArsN2 [Caballeronia sp. PC1]MCE4575551.1 arsenic resistance N-acetyltransferase ArsN2 [Caballeronia sp. CLC5]